MNSRPALQAGRRLPPPALVLSAVFLALLVSAALFPGWLSHADPLGVAPEEAFQGPGLRHWLGTDQSGRDIFARIIHGARPSLLIGLAVMALSMSLAIPLGVISGVTGGWLDRAIGALIDVLFAFPVLLLALLFVAIFGSGPGPVIIATALGVTPGYARLVRGQVRAVRHAPYIEAARALGHSPSRIIRRQILPNALRPLAVLVTMGIGQTIVWASALSFLGLGAKPPAPEWGTMLAAGRDYIAHAWWLSFFPGLCIVLTTLSTTVAGRHLQQGLEDMR
jgi:peptide/nickel transport system permease protein